MSRNILVVDDSPVMRSVIERMIGMTEAEQITVYKAGDGAEARAILARHPINLVITDVHMPNVNGVELLRGIKKHPILRRIDVVMVTSDRTTARQNECRDLGAAAFITKPVTPERIAEVIERFLPSEVTHGV